jgi:hypothetical protein
MLWKTEAFRLCYCSNSKSQREYLNGVYIHSKKYFRIILDTSLALVFMHVSKTVKPEALQTSRCRVKYNLLVDIFNWILSIPDGASNTSFQLNEISCRLSKWRNNKSVSIMTNNPSKEGIQPIPETFYSVYQIHFRQKTITILV